MKLQRSNKEALPAQMFHLGRTVIGEDRFTSLAQSLKAKFEQCSFPFSEGQALGQAILTKQFNIWNVYRNNLNDRLCPGKTDLP